MNSYISRRSVALRYDAFAQDSLEHLSGIVLRELGNKDVRLGTLEPGDLSKAERVQLPLQSRTSCRIASHDASDHLLAPDDMRAPLACDHHDLGVPHQPY